MSISYAWIAALIVPAFACSGAQSSAPQPAGLAGTPAASAAQSPAATPAQLDTGSETATAESRVAPATDTASPTAPVRTVGDVTEPLRVFERFLDLASEGRLDSDEGRALLAPGFDGALNAGDRVRCDVIVRSGATHAVARVSLREPEHSVETGEGDQKFSWKMPARTVDTYWYLEQKDGWRVYTMRALAQTGLLEMMAWMVDDPAALGPEHAANAANARLTLKSDLELAEWFREHRAELDELADRARGLPRAEKPGPDATSRKGELLQRLHLNSASRLENGDVEVVVGGLTDNIVSFRLVADGTLPHITDDDVIWAEALGGGWFLVKTT